MTEELTDADMTMLREAAARGRGTLAGVPLDFTPPPMPGAIADRIASAFAEFGGLPPSDVVYRCRCTAVVPGRLDMCAECIAADQSYRRGRSLADAFASVSPEGAQDWCRVGTRDYLTAVRQAIAVCERFAEPDRTAALRIVQGHYKRADGSLMLLGPTGVGKTAIATACALRVLDLGLRGKLDRDAMKFAVGIRFVSALDMARVREDTRLGVKPPLMLEAERATLLILDEIGFEKRGTDPTIVRDLMWDRARCGKPTIITSGKTRAQLENVSTGYGQPMIRRIEEVGMVIDLHGGSR